MILAFKPDFEEAAKRWDAFLHGEILERPVICVTAPRDGHAEAARIPYRERVLGDLDEIIDQMLRAAEATYYGGEAIPTEGLSFGPDEIACFCGGELKWSEGSGDTNWSEPFVESWADVLPLQIQQENTLWQRMLRFYERAAERLAGKALLSPPDLHTNMDLLAGLRGAGRLCMDLMDIPEVIDRAMDSARAIFPTLWKAVATAGKMYERGFCQNTMYSMTGAAYLQCDFSCMLSPDMFRRWVLPALEEEAQTVKHAVYHWDGPGALVHADALIGSKGLDTLSYVPGVGRSHLDHVELLQRVQAGGKAVEVWGGPDEVKELHRSLRPEKTLYRVWTPTQSEAQGLLEWFKKNT
ncbi:MAG: hypothetical protein V2A58_10565 [Planctomycetota bacterium]